ncbi:hypothetical protein Cgig2_001993 [Carnegiea gigantea]|uniref:Uncharacterized protein n=1 Tax=Carnegiea gigantea TaxID=171969 RepID=A0A9Q1GKI5_9CARY|nr:hypothetical protein Cgig2_001993 [Carnegiea gigantea]
MRIQGRRTGNGCRTIDSQSLLTCKRSPSSRGWRLLAIAVAKGHYRGVSFSTHQVFDKRPKMIFHLILGVNNHTKRWCYNHLEFRDLLAHFNHGKEDYNIQAFNAESIQASTPKSPITCGGIVSAIAYAWELEPLIRQLTPLFQGDDEDEPQPQDENIGGGEGGAGSSGAQAIPPEEKRYEPLLTRSRTKACSSGFNEVHFYSYIDDHFSRLNLRLDLFKEEEQLIHGKRQCKSKDDHANTRGEQESKKHKNSRAHDSLDLRIKATQLKDLDCAVMEQAWMNAHG